jgi:molecular chaperone DnaK (HSP70)
MNPIIGIDLGTTYSAIAKLDQHGKASINSVDGERILPSCIYSPKGDSGSLVVGSLAKNKLDTEPESVLERFKRDMGSDKVYSLS